MRAQVAAPRRADPYGPPAADGLPDPFGALDAMRNAALLMAASVRPASSGPPASDSPSGGTGRAGSRRARPDPAPAPGADANRERIRAHALEHIGQDPRRIAGFRSWAKGMGYTDTLPQQASPALLEQYALSFLQVPARSSSPPRRVERKR